MSATATSRRRAADRASRSSSSRRSTASPGPRPGARAPRRPPGPPAARRARVAGRARPPILEYEIPKFDGDLGPAERLRPARRRDRASARSSTSCAASRRRRRAPGSAPRRSCRCSASAASRPRRPTGYAEGSSPQARDLRRPMRVLVTGHLGYIGTVLVPVLLRAGHEVVGLDSDLYGGCTFGAGRGVPTCRRSTRPARRDGRRPRRASRRSSTSPRCRTTRWATWTRS